MRSPEDDMLNEGGIVPAEVAVLPTSHLARTRGGRAADLRQKADHLYLMAIRQTDAEAAAACREQATRYEMLAEDIDLRRSETNSSCVLG
jgi:hypothetical protein